MISDAPASPECIPGVSPSAFLHHSDLPIPSVPHSQSRRLMSRIDLMHSSLTPKPAAHEQHRCHAIYETSYTTADSICHGDDPTHAFPATMRLGAVQQRPTGEQGAEDAACQSCIAQRRSFPAMRCGAAQTTKGAPGLGQNDGSFPCDDASRGGRTASDWKAGCGGCSLGSSGRHETCVAVSDPR